MKNEDHNSIINEIKSQEAKAIRTSTHSETFQKIISKLKGVKLVADVNSETSDSKVKDYHLVVRVVERTLRAAKEVGRPIRLQSGKLYLFVGTHWRTVETQIIKTLLGQVAITVGVEKEKSKYYKFRDGLYDQLLCVAESVVVNNSQVVKINLVNGTFHIDQSQQELREFDKNDGLKYQLSFGYNPKARCPKFQNFLDEVLPDKDCQKILAEYIGYLFVKSSQLNLDKILMCYGSGANGKSVLFKIVNALLGPENVSNYSLQSLCDSKGYSRAMLADKLVNYSSEISGKLESDIFKLLASGEPVEARLPYGNPFILRDYGKQIFNVNELPAKVELTHGFFRRLTILPFTKTIPKENQNPRLAEQIIETDLPVIFNWALEGLNRVLKQERFSESEEVNRLVNQFQQESDSVRLFVDEKSYKPSQTQKESLSLIYQNYCAFCAEGTYSRVNQKNFRKRLEGAGFHIQRFSSGNMIYLETAIVNND